MLVQNVNDFTGRRSVMYDLTSLVPSYISRTSQRKNILAEKFSTVHFFYNTKMSIRCYLKNDVCMVSDAPSLQPICKENRPYETLTLNFSVW
jgi:hypothetical protein